jgi:hypothetical protein
MTILKTDSLLTLSLRGPAVELPKLLERAGEHLPCLVVVQEIDGFRRASIAWVEGERTHPIANLEELDKRIVDWYGSLVSAEEIVRARRSLEKDARADATTAANEAESQFKQALARQVDAARERLRAELGRFLACLSGGTSRLNHHFHQGMTGAGGTKERLLECFERLGRQYPQWNDLMPDLREYFDELSDNQRKAVVAGSSLDAALADPRFGVGREATL